MAGAASGTAARAALARSATVDDRGRSAGGDAAGSGTVPAEFPVTIDYGQLLVSNESKATLGLLWTDDHVAQGFAWSDGHVVFGVPDHDGDCLVRVEVAPSARLDPAALWAVRVPFRVDEPLMVGALFLPRRVAVPVGGHALTFQALPGTEDAAFELRLTFAPLGPAPFSILKRGEELTTDVVLRRDAVAADPRPAAPPSQVC